MSHCTISAKSFTYYLFQYAKRVFVRPKDVLSGIVLEVLANVSSCTLSVCSFVPVLQPTIRARLNSIAVSTYNTRQNRATYRNILLHGPPGTGKTLFAKVGGMLCLLCLQILGKIHCIQSRVLLDIQKWTTQL